MLDNLRRRLGPAMDAIGRAFARVSPAPTTWTIVGLAISMLAAYEFSTGGYLGGAAGGVLVLASGLFDIVDGAVARTGSRVSKRGAFLDSTLDRVSEAVVFFGVLRGGYADGSWVLAAVSLSLLVSYARAKGDALGISLSGVGVGERSERLLALSVLSILGFVWLGVAAVVVLAALTFVERVTRLYLALR